jgi:4-hydroxybenzoate polyprenyltransferase
LNDTIIDPQSRPTRLKLFLALSRTPHGLLDMATPAMAALLWLGAFPPTRVILLGLVTAFAGYTAVYALNDLIDYHVDKERVRLGYLRAAENYLDDVLIRHPMAHGLLSFREGLCWTAAWALVAVVGAFLLNPVCVVIFVCGCLLEMTYCLLLKVSHLRTLVSGGVKTTGAIAAVFAVDPAPDPFFLLFLFSWLFFWEIGAQNIPHDWADIKEDRRLHSRTIPVRFGPEGATLFIMVSVIIAFIVSIANFYFAKTTYEFPFILAAGCGAVFLILCPAVALYKTKNRQNAMALFNKASYYPLTLLSAVMLKLIFSSLKQ